MNAVERNKELMKKFERMINTADEYLAKEWYLSVVHWMRTGFSDVQWKLEEMAAETDKAAVRWTLTGTHDGEFLGVPATGKKNFSLCYEFLLL